MCISTCACVHVCVRACVRVCVCVCACRHFIEDEGRLQSWTLCNGLSERVVGQGLAAPPPPRPTLVLRRDGRTHTIEEGLHGSAGCLSVGGARTWTSVQNGW